MSWTDWIVSFENKQQITMDWDTVIEFAEQYGQLAQSISSESLYYLQMKHPIGECVLIHGSKIDGVGAISIDRPIDNIYIRPFVCDALSRFGAVLCDQNFTFGCAAKDVSMHIPESILTDGLDIVSQASELYR